ncbi:hypothetical protein K661_03029 [Piscirickettsia salmonis LF-89 = ATCC VR-1361]|nr:hypothetical protein K661_03029 [Piscirickettsia salmonis LF-89 = ATCC VR-1361]
MAPNARKRKSSNAKLLSSQKKSLDISDEELQFPESKPPREAEE